MMVDFGLPYRYAADVVEMAGRYIDLAKLAVGTARLYDLPDMKKFLVAQFGPDVSIANVAPQDILETEALRVGLGVAGPTARTRKRPWRKAREKAWRENPTCS